MRADAQVVSDKTGYGLSSSERNATADALLDRADALETGWSPRKALRITFAALGGKLSGGGTVTNTIRAAGSDSKARITATVESSGNRSAVTLDGSD